MIKYNQNKSTLKLADLEIDLYTRMAKRAGNSFRLTKQESKLLQILIENKNKAVPRDELLSKIWKTSEDIKTRIVDVYMGYLRNKIDQGAGERLIHSVRGVGYMIKKPD